MEQILGNSVLILLMNYRFAGPQQLLPAPLPGYTVGLGYPAPDQVIYSTAKLQNINCIVQPRAESGGLYLGDIISTKKEDLLRRHNIKAILSCGVEAIYNPRDSPTHSVEACKTILAKDLNTYDMSQHFDETYAFISEQVDSNRNVLVHCHAGVSRSATILIAYLMKRNAWTLEKALSVVKSKRARAKPNQSFMKQLKEFQENILGPLLETRNKLNLVGTTDINTVKQPATKEKSVEKENSNSKTTKSEPVLKKEEPAQTHQTSTPANIHQLLEKLSIQKHCFETPKKKAETIKSDQAFETKQETQKKLWTPTTPLHFKMPPRCRLKKQPSTTEFKLHRDLSALPTARDTNEQPESVEATPQKTTSCDTLGFRPSETYSAPRSSANIPFEIPTTYFDYRTLSDNKIPINHTLHNNVRPVTRFIYPINQQPQLQQQFYPAQQQNLIRQSRAVENISYMPRFSEGHPGMPMVRPCTKVPLFEHVQRQ